MLAASAPTTLAGLIDAYASNATVRSVVDVFKTSAESNALYAGDDERFLTAIYASLFNRAPDTAGKAWWLNAIAQGAVSRTQAAMMIMAAAQGSDVERVALKAGSAANFTARLDTETRVRAYDGLDANAVARSMLAKAVPGVAAAVLEQDAAAAISALSYHYGAGMKYDIAPDVPATQATLLKTGFAIAQDFLDSQFGGGIPASVSAGMTVKVVATGRGNEEAGGGGSCCTGLALGPNGSTLLRPFFDVRHSQWDLRADVFQWPLDTDHMKVAVHEYTHDWQGQLGCLGISAQPLGFWINEGLAEFVALEAMFARGAMDRAQLRQFMLQAAYATGELGAPLRDFGGTSAPLWPGHIGYLALDRLVHSAPLGMRSVRTVCEQVAAGASVASAFRGAFGIELEAFYTQFEALRPQLIAEAKGG
ncbi:MAG: DUF4214 domain-containing protein [Pseudomonadota bacterium]